MRASALLLLAALAAAAEPRIVRQDDAVVVELDGGVRLEFALDRGRLLGLVRAQVGGIDLKSPATCWRPLVFDERGSAAPTVSHALVLRAVRAAGDAVEVECDVAVTDTAWRSIYVVAPDRAAAAADPALADLRRAAEAAEAALRTRAEQDPAVVKERDALERHAAAKPADDDATPAGNGARMKWQFARMRLQNARDKAFAALRAQGGAEAAALTAYDAALDRRGLAIGRIHRDAHGFPLLRQPCELATPTALRALADAAPAAVAGRLVWTLRPDGEVIAGWPWRGFRSALRVELAEGRAADGVRWIGSWELGGDAVGTTLVAHRYRGLGGLEQTLAPGADGAVGIAFTTTEILPGAVGSAPVISPAVPASVDVADRGWALRHRAGAWIARLARGAGAPWLDFQWRAESCLAIWPERQGELRAVTEVFPGDRVVSQTDEEAFERGRLLVTTPMRHLVLPGPHTPHGARTRWREAEAAARAAAAQELGFVERPPQPAAGWNIDTGFAGRMQSLAAQVPRYAELGVRQVLIHQPGWICGRALREGATDGIAYWGGGDCMIYDWWPLAQVREPWLAFQRACAERGIAAYVWISNYNHARGPLAQRTGVPPAQWAAKADGSDETAGDVVMHDLANPAIRDAVHGRLEEARRAFGFQGFWIDSFQSNGFYRFARADRAPLQRAYWEQLAAWTRVGVGVMAESHAVPGLSCSIEVGDDRYPADWWALPMTVKWYRAGRMPGDGTAEADAIVFRLLAGGACVAPDARDRDPAAVIPAYARLAAEWAAAAPLMRRPFLLPDNRGALWLAATDGEGVLFPLVDADVPAGVVATPVRGGDPASRVIAGTSWRVRGDDLLAAFALAKPPLADDRRGRAPADAPYTWTVKP